MLVSYSFPEGFFVVDLSWRFVDITIVFLLYGAITSLRDLRCSALFALDLIRWYIMGVEFPDVFLVCVLMTHNVG